MDKEILCYLGKRYLDLFEITSLAARWFVPRILTFLCIAFWFVTLIIVSFIPGPGDIYSSRSLSRDLDISWYPKNDVPYT